MFTVLSQTQSVGQRPLSVALLPSSFEIWNSFFECFWLKATRNCRSSLMFRHWRLCKLAHVVRHLLPDPKFGEIPFHFLLSSRRAWQQELKSELQKISDGDSFSMFQRLNFKCAPWRKYPRFLLASTLPSWRRSNTSPTHITHTTCVDITLSAIHICSCFTKKYLFVTFRFIHSGVHNRLFL